MSRADSTAQMDQTGVGDARLAAGSCKDSACSDLQSVSPFGASGSWLVVRGQPGLTARLGRRCLLRTRTTAEEPRASPCQHESRSTPRCAPSRSRRCMSTWPTAGCPGSNTSNGLRGGGGRPPAPLAGPGGTGLGGWTPVSTGPLVLAGSGPRGAVHAFPRVSSCAGSRGSRSAAMTATHPPPCAVRSETARRPFGLVAHG